MINALENIRGAVYNPNAEKMVGKCKNHNTSKKIAHQGCKNNWKSTRSGEDQKVAIAGDADEGEFSWCDLKDDGLRKD